VTLENQGSLDAQGIHVDEFAQSLSPHVVSGWMQIWELGKRHGAAPTNPPGNSVRARTLAISLDEDSLISFKGFAKLKGLLVNPLLSAERHNEGFYCLMQPTFISYFFQFGLHPGTRWSTFFLLCNTCSQ
jgi:hypothetical protein